MPSSSWVAKWNNLEGMKPGIYAVNILEDDADQGEAYADYQYTQKMGGG